MEHIRAILPKRAAAKARIPTVSTMLDDGRLVELLHSPAEHRTALCVGRSSSYAIVEELADDAGRLVPYSATNNLLENEIVLFPSAPEPYANDIDLVRSVQSFIHSYVDVSPRFERLSAYYVLLTWIYDSFNELPYLRLLGDPGSGKTRFLLTVGSLCFKPIFASGASTVSPLFRLLDIFRGTLIVDEADFRLSDERAEIIKILNNGNGRGFPVLRSEASHNGKEFNPRAYIVFGPKIVATRRRFQDAALETRCLTEEMGRRPLRADIPLNLPSKYKEEALRLRNQLLTFRLRHGGQPVVISNIVDATIEPRLNQVFAPLLSIMTDDAARAELRALAREYNRELVADRGQENEARVLEIIRDLRGNGSAISIKAITVAFTERYAPEYERKITPKWIGYLVRRRLFLRTRKSDGTFVLEDADSQVLATLFERYGVPPERGDGESTGT